MRGLDYDDEKWDALLDQLTPSDYQTLITQSGYGTAAIKSVDKPSTADRDTATGLINFGFDASGNLYFKGNITHCGVIVLAQTYNDDLPTTMAKTSATNPTIWVLMAGMHLLSICTARHSPAVTASIILKIPLFGGHIASLECKGVVPWYVRLCQTFCCQRSGKPPRRP